MTGFLTDADLQQLTGYIRTQDQARWLTRNRVKHYRQRLTGKPVVTWAAVEGREASPAANDSTPRLDWVQPRRA